MTEEQLEEIRKRLDESDYTHQGRWGEEPISVEGDIEDLLDLVATLRAKLAEAERWETGFRNIVTIVAGPRSVFNIPDIVEQVRSKAAALDIASAALTQARAKLADTQERLSDAEYSVKFARNHRDELGAALTQARADLEEEKRRRALDIAASHRARRLAERAEAVLREAREMPLRANDIIDAYFTQQSPQGQKDDQ